jgi:hypothetical protein
MSLPSMRTCSKPISPLLTISALIGDRHAP